MKKLPLALVMSALLGSLPFVAVQSVHAAVESADNSQAEASAGPRVRRTMTLREIVFEKLDGTSRFKTMLAGADFIVDAAKLLLGSPLIEKPIIPTKLNVPTIVADFLNITYDTVSSFMKVALST